MLELIRQFRISAEQEDDRGQIYIFLRSDPPAADDGEADAPADDERQPNAPAAKANVSAGEADAADTDEIHADAPAGEADGTAATEERP